MGASKTHIFNLNQNTLAIMAKVLAHPARVAILEYIHKYPMSMCNDLVSATGLSQPTISQHLSEIKRVGLLQASFKGKNLYYTLNHEKWTALQIPFNTLFSKLNNNSIKKINDN